MFVTVHIGTLEFLKFINQAVRMKLKKTKKMTGEKTNKRTRGYRLKPETHKLIVKIQKMLKSDQDAAIAGACRIFYAELQKNNLMKSGK